MINENLIQEILEGDKQPFIEVPLSERDINKLRIVLESKNIYFQILDFSDVDSKQKLMHEFEEKLEFPEYFGRNWDALRDCLCDFSWIDPSKGYVFVVSCLPNLNLYETYILLHILYESWVVWLTNGEKRIFKIIFPPFKK